MRKIDSRLSRHSEASNDIQTHGLGRFHRACLTFRTSIAEGDQQCNRGTSLNENQRQRCGLPVVNQVLMQANVLNCSYADLTLVDPIRMSVNGIDTFS